MRRTARGEGPINAIIVAAALCLSAPPAAFSGGIKIAVVELLPDLRIVGTVEVKNFDVTYWATPSERLPGHIQQHGTHERAATVADILVTKDGRWEASGKIAIVAPRDLRGLNTAKGGNTMVLLWNTGHQVNVTMEAGAATVIRGKRVHAEKKVSFLLAEKDHSQFEARLRDGRLTVVGAGRAPTADAPPDSGKQAAAQPVRLSVDWIGTAKVRKCAVERLNGASLAVSVRFIPSQRSPVLTFTRENTAAVLSDGRELNEWLVWLPRVQRGGNQIRINKGSMNDIQIILADDDHNKTHGRRSGNGSRLEVGGEMGLLHRMVYHNGTTGKLVLRFSGPDDVKDAVFLFPFAEGKSPSVKRLLLAGLEASVAPGKAPAKAVKGH